MCTVSWWRRDGRLSLRFNRDEQRGRAEADPPGDHDGLLYPRDPLGGGTWLCLDAGGTVHCLLNYYDAQHPHIPDHPRSRGLLPLASARNPGPIGEWLDPTPYPPFHLLRVPRVGPIEHVCWDSRQMFAGPAHADVTHWTTSGWNSQWVVKARGALFQEMLSRDGLAESTLQAFHHAQHPEQPGLWPLMSRSDARTVSLSEIQSDETRRDFSYEALAS